MLISITDPASWRPTPAHKFKEIHNFEFLDVEANDEVLDEEMRCSHEQAAELVRLLVKEGHAVQVVMTQAACGFITPATLQALSGKPVFTDMWDGRVADGMMTSSRNPRAAATNGLANFSRYFRTSSSRHSFSRPLAIASSSSLRKMMLTAPSEPITAISAEG